MYSEYQNFQSIGKNLPGNLRAVFRLLRAGVHLLWAAVLVGIVFPALGQSPRDRLKQRWAAQLLDMLGIQWQAEGATMEAGLCVANHISWLDIIVITASMPSTFLAKEEVRRWPLIGWISTQAGTCYVQRGSRMAAYRSTDNMTSLLQTGQRVVVFPEGTSSDGRDVLPFHSALVQSAINARVALQPVALRYTCLLYTSTILLLVLVPLVTKKQWSALKMRAALRSLSPIAPSWSSSCPSSSTALHTSARNIFSP